MMLDRPRYDAAWHVPGMCLHGALKESSKNLADKNGPHGMTLKTSWRHPTKRRALSASKPKAATRRIGAAVHAARNTI